MPWLFLPFFDQINWQPTDNMTLFENVLDFKAQLPSQIQQMCLKNGLSKNKSN